MNIGENQVVSAPSENLWAHGGRGGVTLKPKKKSQKGGGGMWWPPKNVNGKLFSLFKINSQENWVTTKLKTF